jgi:hypothetical protein
MMVKSAQPSEVGGVHALPLSLYLPITAKLWCKLKGADTLPLFLLYPTLYSVVHSELRKTDRQAERYRAEHEIERRPE